MVQYWPLLAGLLVLLGTNIDLAGAGTCKPSTCSQSGGSGLFKYKTGNTYIYNLDGKTLTDLPEQQGEPIKTELKAVAEVNFGADCTNTLKLRDVKVTGPNAKVYGDLKELEAYPVRFSYNDGVLEPEICADNEDSNTALNIKRAVISLFQVSSSQSSGTKYEVDIFGSCPTNFRSEVKGGDTVITKSRDLNKCAHREDLRNRVSTSDYVTNSDLQSAPILDSNLVVEVSINNGLVKTAESHEIYLYRPFSNREAGAKTVVHTTLTFVSKAAGPAHPCKANDPQSIIFDSPHSDSNAKSSPATIVAAMQGCKSAMTDSVSDSSAAEFRRLVEVFRSSNKNDLLTVFGQVKAGAGFADKDAAKKLYLDALFRAGNGDTIQAAIELLKANEFSDTIARLWYTSFAFARHATPASLVSAASLLDAPNAPVEAYLGVGSLAARYCNEHSCDNLPAYNELLAKISKPLAGKCKCSSFEQENKVIAALKGIENMKGVNAATAALVSACYANPAAPARVRVAALETARSDACQPLFKKSSLEILSNVQEDSEIRIKAYLAAVECPCGKCANTVKEVLDKEPVNQVGSYIVSHLRNLRASTNPDKANQKQHLSAIRTSNKFPFDVRKFSRNYEVSGLLDAVNIGSSLEADVIYSQQSYLPRSTSFNLTVDVFGHSVNLLEIGTRAQNLDRLFESMFGPKGYAKSNKPEDLFANGKDRLKALKEKLAARFSKSLRAKRSVSPKALEAFRKTVYQPNENKLMNLDLNVKLFGSTLAHSSYHGDGYEFSCDGIIDKFFDSLDNGVNDAKSFNHMLRHHAVFYENEMSYPTGTGFPLKLTVSGSAAIAVKLDGKVDLAAIIKDPKNAHFQFEVIPSAAVEVVGMMSVDAYAVESGLKVSSNLHTATGVSVNVKSVDGTGIDVSVGLPIKKQEVINVQTEILSSVSERGLAAAEAPIAFNTKRKDFHGCFDQLSALVGLTFCSDVGIPFEGMASKAAFYPLNGPSKFLLTIESDDVLSYKFKAGLNLKDDDRRAIEILIDTPNSKTNRKVELIIEALRKPNLEFRVRFQSPIKALGAEIIYVNTPAENSLAVSVSEDTNEYFIKLGADITGSGNHMVYAPSLEYKMGGGQTSERIVASKKSKGKKAQKQQAQADYRIEGTIAVDKEADSRKYTFNSVNVIVPIGQLAVNGWVEHDKSSLSSDLKLILGGDNEIAVVGKAELLSKSHFKVKGSLQASHYPDLGGSIDWEYNRGVGQLESLLVLVHGKDLTSKQACLTAKISAKYQGTCLKDVDFSGEGSVTYPLMGVVGKISGDLKPNGFNYAVEGAYEKYSAKSGGSLKIGVKAPGDYDFQIETKVLDNYFKLASHRDVISPQESKCSSKLEMSPGGTYEISARTFMRNELQNVLQKVSVELKMDKQPEPYNLDYGLEVNTVVFDTHLKASQGSTDFIDVASIFKKEATRTGKVKVCISNHLDSNLDMSIDSAKGSLSGFVTLVKLKRTMHATGSLKIVGTNNIGEVDLTFDEADPSKKIHFQTASDIKGTAIDSKNTLDVFGYKTQFNVAGDRTGSLSNGQLKGNAEVTLPTGHHLTGTLDHTLHLKATDTDGNWKVGLTCADKKGGPARSLQLEAKADNCDRTLGYFNVDFNAVYKDLQGKDVTYMVAGKHLPDGENRHVELLGKVQGSLLNLAPMVHVKVDVVQPITNYAVKVNLAADSNLELVGKVQCGSDGTRPYLLENALEVNLPTGELKNIKVVESWSYVKGVNGAPCELKGAVTSTYNGANTVKADVEIKASTTEGGQGKLTLALPNDELRVLKATYNIGKEPGINREVSLTSIHGAREGGVDIKVNVPQDRNSFHVKVDGRTPVEAYKTFGLVADSERKENSVESQATFALNDQKAVVTSKYGLDWRSPIFEVGVVHPKGKSLVAFYCLSKAGGAGQYESEVKYEHNGDAGYAKADVNFPSVHDFTVTVDADVPKLKINKVNLVVANTPGVKGGKRISVVQTEAGQPIVNGNLAYEFKDGSDGALFEASGVLKVKGENRQAKIIVKKTVISSPAETGLEYSLSSTLGDQTIEGLFKQTTKEIRLLAKGCRSAGACGFADYCAKYNIDGLDFNNEVTAEVDTTGLGMTTAVAFKRVTEKKDMEFLHKVELSSRNQQIFSFKVGFNDKTSTICLITPTREMAADASYALVADPANSRHYTYKYEGSVWLDRAREPAAKSTGIFEMDYLRTDDSVTVISEAKFVNPALGKDMVVKGTTTVGGRQLLDTRVEIDVFAKKGQKITIDGKVGKSQIASGYNFTSTWDFKSKGQGLDLVAESHLAASTNLVGFGSSLVFTDKDVKKDLGFGVEASLTRAVIFMKSPQDILLDFSTSSDWNEGFPSGEFSLAMAGCKGMVGNAAFKEGGRLIYALYKKETPDRKVQGEVVFDYLTKANTRLDWITGPETKQIYSFGFNLDEQIAPDMSFSFDNVKLLIEFLREDLKKFVEKAKIAGAGLSADANAEFADFAEGLRKAQPNLKPLLTAYQEQLNAIRNEVASDKNVDEISTLIKQFAAPASEIFAQAAQVVAKIADRILAIFEEFSNAIIGSLKRIVPQITDSFAKITSATTDIFNIAATQVLNGLQKLVELCKKFEPELKTICGAFADMSRDIFRAISQTFGHVCKELKDFVSVICDQIKALPVVSMVQERIADIKLQIKEVFPKDMITKAIREVTTTLKFALPTQELRDFVDYLTLYLEKVASFAKVDHTAEYKKLYPKAIAAYKSVVTLIKAEAAGREDSAGPIGFFAAAWQFSLKTAFKIPRWASVHISPLRYIQLDDLPSPSEIFTAYVPRSINPVDLVAPFTSYAAVIDTSHFYTFDGRQFAFKGACSYVLAQDSTNGNFSLVLNLEKNKFQSMQLSDDKDTIEVTAQGTLLLNGQPCEYPYNSDTLSAWRRYHTINFKSSAGILVTMDSEYHVSIVQLSGFYHGQVRGLLGDANYEEFDDFRMPNGKISTDAAEFGNAYQVEGKCAPGTAAAHPHPHEEECNNLFSANSPLRPAFLFVKPDEFRESCDHLVGETTTKKKEYACRVAAAYIHVAAKNGISVDLPSSCASCEAPAKKIPVGDVLSVKAPSQKADVVIIFEQVTNNAQLYNDLVTPLVASLTADLKSKGINDVAFSLVGYGHPQQRWPAHHTTNGKLAFDGTSKLEFGDAEKYPKEMGTTSEEKYAYFKRKFLVEVGMTKISDAIKEVGRYPFRAGASRAVLLVAGTPCETGLTFGLQTLRALILEKLATDRGLSMHVVTPMEGFNIMGNKDAKTQKGVVGFDSDAVYSLADGKKKTLDGAGSEDLRKDIEYNRDICIDAALKTGGAAFNANNFIDAKASQRKQFLQVVTNKLVSALSSEFTEECRCVLRHGLYPETRCRVIDRKTSEPIKAQAETKRKGGKKPKN